MQSGAVTTLSVDGPGFLAGLAAHCRGLTEMVLGEGCVLHGTEAGAALSQLPGLSSLTISMLATAAGAPVPSTEAQDDSNELHGSLVYPVGVLADAARLATAAGAETAEVGTEAGCSSKLANAAQASPAGVQAEAVGLGTTTLPAVAGTDAVGPDGVSTSAMAAAEETAEEEAAGEEEASAAAAASKEAEAKAKAEPGAPSSPRSPAPAAAATQTQLLQALAPGLPPSVTSLCISDLASPAAMETAAMPAACTLPGLQQLHMQADACWVLPAPQVRALASCCTDLRVLGIPDLELDQAALDCLLLEAPTLRELSVWGFKGLHQPSRASWPCQWQKLEINKGEVGVQELACVPLHSLTQPLVVEGLVVPVHPALCWQGPVGGAAAGAGAGAGASGGAGGEGPGAEAGGAESIGVAPVASAAAAAGAAVGHAGALMAMDVFPAALAWHTLQVVVHAVHNLAVSCRVLSLPEARLCISLEGGGSSASNGGGSGYGAGAGSSGYGAGSAADLMSWFLAESGLGSPATGAGTSGSSSSSSSSGRGGASKARSREAAVIAQVASSVSATRAALASAAAGAMAAAYEATAHLPGPGKAPLMSVPGVWEALGCGSPDRECSDGVDDVAAREGALAAAVLGPGASGGRAGPMTADDKSAYPSHGGWVRLLTCALLSALGPLLPKVQELQLESAVLGAAEVRAVAASLGPRLRSLSALGCEVTPAFWPAVTETDLPALSQLVFYCNCDGALDLEEDIEGFCDGWWQAKGRGLRLAFRDVPFPDPLLCPPMVERMVEELRGQHEGVEVVVEGMGQAGGAAAGGAGEWTWN